MCLISNNEHEKLTQVPGPKSSWSFYLILSAVVTTLGSSLPVGYNIGVVNTPADIIKQFCNESVISRYDVELSKRWLDTLWSCVVSIFIVGGCTGSILGAYCANSLGRKKATILTNILSLVGALLFVCCRAANSVEMLILGRLIVGLSAGLTTSIVPMYLTELSPLSVSGAMGVACPMGVNVGVLAGQVMGLKFLLGAAEDWPYLLSVYAILVIICLPVLFILPESPKYLFVIKKNENLAIKELSRCRGLSPSLLQEDIELLRSEAQVAETASLSGETQWTMLKVLCDKRLRLPLLLVCSMQAGQQTSGINAVFYYSTLIFKQAGLSQESSQYATIGCGAVNVATALLMVYLLPRVGRRPLLLGSVTAAAAFLFALAACMNFLTVSGMSYVCIMAVLGYVIAYGFGLGPVPYFIASEMFEVGPRPAGMAWGSLANWTGNFLVGMTFPLMKDYMGAYSFIVFAVTTTLLAVFQK
ncbi:sugar transporter domain-containing protein [Phthorimaea operculella]|nr:sugar transporter domain-containing protein [Phthorimaea operculella]